MTVPVVNNTSVNTNADNVGAINLFFVSVRDDDDNLLLLKKSPSNLVRTNFVFEQERQYVLCAIPDAIRCLYSLFCRRPIR